MRLSPVRLLSLLLAVGLAAGCSLNESPPVATAAPGAASGGVLTVAIGRPGSIDPTNVYEPNGQLVVQTMCESLLQQDPSTGHLRGALAETFTTTETGSRFIIRLRDGLRFSNGEAMTSDDVAATLTRLASRDFASARQDLVALVGGFEFVSGAVESKNDDDRARLEGVRVIDSRSLEIRLRGRMGDYIRILAEAVTSPLPRKLIQDAPESLERNPVCVGPYRLAAPWDGQASQIKLVRNQHYDRGNPAYTDGGRGYADEVVFKIFPTPAARLAAWQARKVDVAPLLGQQAARLPATASLQVGPGPSVQFVGVPTTGRFSDPRTRAALSLALDRQAISASVFGGLASPATGYLSPALGDKVFQPNACDLRKPTQGAGRGLAFPVTGVNLTPSRADLVASRRLLAQARVELRGQTLSFRYNNEGRNPALARTIAATWQKAFGLKVRLVPMPWRDYLAMATGTTGFDGAFLESWTPDYPGPEQYIGPLFTAAGVGEDNWSRWNNPAFDTELARIVRAQEEPEDLAVSYRSSERFLCSNVPLIPLVFGKTAALVNTARWGTASNAWLHHSTGTIMLREIYRKDQA